MAAQLTIAQVRAKFPQYHDMSDRALADALHQKFYADVPKDKFYAKIGLGQSEAAKDAATVANRTGEGGPLSRFVSEKTLHASDAIGALGFAAGTGLANLAGDHRYGMGQAYSAYRQAEIDAGNKRASPLTTAAGMAGALSVPGLGAASKLIRGAPVAEGASKALAYGGKMVRGALVGAGVGSVHGAADAPSVGSIPRSARRGAVSGALVGGGVAAAAPVAGRAVGAVAKGGRALGGSLGAVAESAKNFAKGRTYVPLTQAQEQEGSRKALSYLGGRIAASGKSIRDLVSTAHPEGTVAEGLGRSAVEETRSLASRPGETSELAHAQFRARADGRSQRILDAVHQTTGIDPTTARAGVEGVIQAGRKEAAPLFDAVRNHAGPVWSPELAQIAQRPVVRKAIAAVGENMLNAGEDPKLAGIKLDPDTGGPTQNAGNYHKLASVVENQPLAKTWEAVRQMIGNQVERHPITMKPLPDSESAGNAGIWKAQSALGDQLRKEIPGLGPALDKAGEYKQVEGGFNRTNGKLFSSSFRPDQMQQAFGSARNKAEARAMRHGVAAELADAADKNTLTVRSLSAPGVQKKLTTSFGKAAADKLVETIKQEEGLMSNGNRMRPETPSGSIAEYAKQHDAVGNADAEEFLANVNTHGLRGAVTRAVTAPVKTVIGGAKTPGGIAFRNALGKLYLMHPSDLEAAVQAARPVAQKTLPSAMGRITRAALPNAGVPAASVIVNAQDQNQNQ